MQTLATTDISVLDLAKFSQGQTIEDAFASMRELAPLAEKLGYKRYWLAEHHNIDGISSAATSVLIGYVAGLTKTIRVGSGGIMLPNHAPLVIAEQFGTLATLYPGRIDLGLGRAPGTDPWTMRALRRESRATGDEFPDLIEELRGFLGPAHDGQKIRAIPGQGTNVPIYILGSSLYSAQLAAHLGLPYSFAGHFAPQEMDQAFQIYRSEFTPSEVLERPYVMVGAPVIAADTDERARFLSTSLLQTFLGMVRRNRIKSPPPVEDMDAIWSPQEKAYVQSMLELLVVGNAASVRKGLDQLIERTGADELIILSDVYDPRDRLHSFEVIAQAKAL